MLKKLRKKTIKFFIYFSAVALVFNLIFAGAFFNAPYAFAMTPPALNPEDIIITEIMKDPNAVNDNQGEWFEIYNTTDHQIDLWGCVIQDNSADTHMIASSIIVLSNDYAVLGIEDDTTVNGGVSVDYEYSNFDLANADDEIILTCGAAQIDKVEYDDGVTFPDLTGKSMILANISLDNNNGANWCESSTAYGSGDLGTPGASNDSCYADISGYKYYDGDNNTNTAADQIDLANWQIYLSNEQTQTTSTAITTLNGYFEFNNLLPGDYVLSEQEKNKWSALTPTSSNITLNWQTSTTTNFINHYQVEPGEIIINELMWMGSNTSTYDEWIELYNTSTTTIDISGWQLTKYSVIGGIYQENLMLTIPYGNSIGPNKYFLISNFDTDGSNINIAPDLVDTNVELANNQLQIKLYKSDWTNSANLIDTADDAVGEPLAGENTTPKKSMSRKTGTVNGTLPESWCNAGSQTNWGLQANELGTPGAVNTCEGDPGWLEIYKYEDLDGLASTTNDQILTATTTWSFIIDSGTATTTATTTNGYIKLSLNPGQYTITEEILDNWFVINPITGTTTAQINTATTTTVNFFNTHYSTISGYKYKDLDNNSSTDEYLQNPVENWLISLFNSNSTSTPVATTTTNDLGYFEFAQLVPDTYQIIEEKRSSWIALSASLTEFILLSGTNTSTDFINYKQEYGPLTSPGQSDGAGPFKQNPKLDLMLNYPIEKDLNKTYVETIVISNKGNIVLTNGVLTLDLPQDKLHLISGEPDWYDYSPSDELAVWHIPAMMVGQELSFEIEVEPLIEGQAETLVYVIFDQDSKESTMTENLILIKETGGLPEPAESAGEQAGSKQGLETNQKKEITLPQVISGKEFEGEIAGEVIEEPSFVPKGTLEAEQNGKINGGAAESKFKVVFAPDWWQWAIILILLLAIIMGYYLSLKNKEE